MKFLLDENVSSGLALRLRSKGDTVIMARDALGAGAVDEAVFNLAKKERSILISFDSRDFSNIIRFSPQGTPGIIVIRMSKTSITAINDHVFQTISSRAEDFWGNCLTIIEPARIRQRH